MGGMAEAVLRGLAAMEAVGAGDRTVSDVARRLLVDKSTASRLLASLVREGWLHRQGDEFDLGPRSAVLGVGGPEQRFVGHARAVAHAVAGVTGRHVTVMQHAGRARLPGGRGRRRGGPVQRAERAGGVPAVGHRSRTLSCRAIPRRGARRTAAPNRFRRSPCARRRPRRVR